MDEKLLNVFKAVKTKEMSHDKQWHILTVERIEAAKLKSDSFYFVKKGLDSRL